MHSDMNDPKGSGCPIRRSQDRSSVTSSPRLIAGSYVLHRLLTPRHPPCALVRLATPTGLRRTCVILSRILSKTGIDSNVHKTFGTGGMPRRTAAIGFRRLDGLMPHCTALAHRAAAQTTLEFISVHRASILLHRHTAKRNRPGAIGHDRD